MIILKSPAEIEKIKTSSKIVALTLDYLKDKVCEGVTTLELDRLAEEFILKNKAKPAFKGYRGYKNALCVSVNEQIVHGIPGDRRLKEGDVVGIDCGAFKDGYYGDSAYTYAVGRVSDVAKKLMDTGKKALQLAIENAVVGNRLYDISAVVQETAEVAGFSVVRDLVGHGIGRNLHEEPQVPNYGLKGTGVKLRPGLVLAIEPMLNEGTWEIKQLSDGWTIVTKDNKLSVHYEHTVAITENGTEILSVVS